MNNDVFISYSHKDKAIADAIVNHLENRNIRCWYAPRDIASGQEWADSIINAICSSKAMILIFTDFANESVQVRREVDNAISRGLTIVPFKLTQEPPKGAMEYYLSTLHWLDALNEPLEDAIDGLCQRMVTILENKDTQKTEVFDTTRNFKSNVLNTKSRILIGVFSTIFFLVALFLVMAGLMTVLEDFSGGILTFVFGLFLGIPSVAGLVMTIEKRKLTSKGFTITGCLILLSFAFVVYVCVAFL